MKETRAFMLLKQGSQCLIKILLFMGFLSTIADAADLPGLNSAIADDKNTGQEWTINLLSYPNRSDADGFLDRLRNKGFKTEIIPVYIGEKTLYRVRATGLTSLADARTYRTRLKSRTNIRDDHIRIIGPQSVAVVRKWTIKLLSYPTQLQAAGFIKRLKKKDFIAVMTPVQVNGETLYQIRATGLASLADAKAYRVRLKSRTNIRDSHIRIIGPSERVLSSVTEVAALDEETSASATAFQQESAVVAGAGAVVENANVLDQLVGKAASAQKQQSKKHPSGQVSRLRAVKRSLPWLPE